MKQKNIQHILVETDQGSYGLLPHRLDCVAALVPGILIFQSSYTPDPRGTETYIAVDAGVLVKTGMDVVVSVRHAVVGNDLDNLHEAVDKNFIQQNERNQKIHAVFKKMESDFITRLSDFHKDP
ncbi:F0F1 ATP synthase subunit epsilon [Simiduia litorea]|uniref:F0F1 ATP synthase subunit epsilon n=1 Tax=Simiduia litorea TaxID=1435348 RepID=UPI0036F26FD4